MSNIYDQGYKDALIYDWTSMPDDEAATIIAGYKSRAAANEYLAGLAQGAHDAIVNEGGVSMDRFVYGLPDPQCALVIGFCDACGGEIYEGNEVAALSNGRMIHDNFDCRFDAGLREYEEDELYGDAGKTSDDVGQPAIRKAG